MNSSLDHVITADGRLRVWTTFKGAAPNELFRYWTEPDLLEMWWPSEAVLEPVPGGPYRFSFPKTGRTLTGTFSEVNSGQRLVFTWIWQNEPDSPAQHVITDFERRDDDTLLTVTQGPYSESSADKARRQTQKDDWAYFLGRLKSVYDRT